MIESDQIISLDSIAKVYQVPIFRRAFIIPFIYLCNDSEVEEYIDVGFNRKIILDFLVSTDS
jgi:hypothetical protein